MKGKFELFEFKQLLVWSSNFFYRWTSFKYAISSELEGFSSCFENSRIIKEKLKLYNEKSMDFEEKLPQKLRKKRIYCNVRLYRVSSFDSNAFQQNPANVKYKIQLNHVCVFTYVQFYQIAVACFSNQISSK